MPHLWSASLLSQTVTGANIEQKVPRLVDPLSGSASRDPLDLPRGALVASSSGYSLHAATRIEANDRDALERLLLYMARPPLAQGRLMLREDGKIFWNLRRPWRDGTRGFVFDPLTFSTDRPAGQLDSWTADRVTDFGHPRSRHRRPRLGRYVPIRACPVAR